MDVLIRIIRSESLKREDVQRSCPFLNLSTEMSGIDERFAEGRQKFIGLALRHDGGTARGQKRRVVRRDINASETATFVIAAWEGYVVLGKNSQDPRTMQLGQRRVSGHLESLRPARARRRVAGRG